MSLGLGGLRGAAAELQYNVVHARETRGPAASVVRGAGNAGHGASPTTGNREGFSF
jgi:hypothetical protein